MCWRGGRESYKRFILGVGLAGGVGSLLIEASHSIALLLMLSEFEVLEVVEDES
jgi:hypothetical protein